jgi:hypothetical protein
MPDAPLNPVNRNGQIRAGEVKRLSASTMKSSRMTAANGLGLSESAAGFNVTNLLPEKIYLQITGGGANGEYSWTRAAAISQTQFVPLGDGPSGTFDGTPAVEINGNTSVPVDGSAFAEATLDSVNGCYRFSFGGAGSGEVEVLILDIISASNIPSGSACNSGSTSVSGNDCPQVFHHGTVVGYEAQCEGWETTACAFVTEIEGRRLEIGRKYKATRIGNVPPSILGAIAPVPPPPCTYDANTPLYLVDIGTPAHSIRVQSLIGLLCTGSGSDSASAAGQDSPNLILYHATIERWNTETCLYEITDDSIYVAEMHGCPLVLNRHYEGVYNRMVKGWLDGSGSGAESGTGTAFNHQCNALYLIDHLKDPPTGISDIQCVNGILNIYTWQKTDNCGTVASVFSYSAGCCDCTGSGTGSGGCPCTGSPTATNFAVTTFALTNSGCSNCAAFPSSFNITNTGSCTWQSNTLFSPCGGSSGASLTCDGTNFNLYLSGSGGSFSAHYALSAGSFACNGVNTMTKVSSAGCNFPATITLTPF